MERTEFMKAARAEARRKRQNLRNELNEMKGLERRTDALGRFIETMPNKIKRRADMSLSVYGTYCYVTVRPKHWPSLPKSKQGFTENDTLLITEWCAGLGERWNFRKSVNGSEGTWRHEVRKWIGNNLYEITFDTTSNIDGCELVEVTETVEQTRFEVKC